MEEKSNLVFNSLKCSVASIHGGHTVMEVHPVFSSPVITFKPTGWIRQADLLVWGLPVDHGGSQITSLTIR